MLARVVVLFALAALVANVVALDAAMVEQWVDAAEASRPHLDELPNDGAIMRFQEVENVPAAAAPAATAPAAATPVAAAPAGAAPQKHVPGVSNGLKRRAQGKPGTIDGLHTALVWDAYKRDGDELAEAKRHLSTLKVEPPAALPPPIVGDVDQKILDMAYDLSFKKRPAKPGKAKPKSPGAGLMKTLKRMKKELKTVLKPAAKAEKKKAALKAKAKGKGKGKAKAAAKPSPKAEAAAVENAEAAQGPAIAEAATAEAK